MLEREFGPVGLDFRSPSTRVGVRKFRSSDDWHRTRNTPPVSKVNAEYRESTTVTARSAAQFSRCLDTLVLCEPKAERVRRSGKLQPRNAVVEG